MLEHLSPGLRGVLWMLVHVGPTGFKLFAVRRDRCVSAPVRCAAIAARISRRCGPWLPSRAGRAPGVVLGTLDNDYAFVYVIAAEYRLGSAMLGSMPSGGVTQLAGDHRCVRLAGATIVARSGARFATPVRRSDCTRDASARATPCGRARHRAGGRDTPCGKARHTVHQDATRAQRASSAATSGDAVCCGIVARAGACSSGISAGAGVLPKENARHTRAPNR